MSKDNDKLIATTLAEAEAHRATFRDLVRDNEQLKANYQERSADLDKRQIELEAAEARVRNTADSQAAQDSVLTDREAAVKAGEEKLVSDHMAFENDSTARSAELDERKAKVAAGERDLDSARVSFENVQRRSLDDSAKRESDLADRESRLVAGEIRLKNDAAAFQEERAGYKDKVRAEVIAELTKNAK